MARPKKTGQVVTVEKTWLSECKAEGDAESVRTQEKVIRLIERKLEEAMKPARRELEAAGERYGWDFY